MRLLLAFLLILDAFLFHGCARSKPEHPENLLLITLDTTRADHLGAYGYTNARTPNMDALASRGVLFQAAFSNIPLTRPSHASLFTGMLPRRHGIWSNGPYRLEDRFVTIAEKFRTAGFRTAAVISSFVLGKSFGLAQGFDTYDDRVMEVAGADPEKNADAVADAAEKLLGEPSQKPFFLWLHFYDGHYPYEPPEPFRSQFKDREYDGELAYMDQQIGRVLQKLDAMGHSKTTLVAVIADHGESLGEHGESTHGYFIYDSTMRVPLILAGPSVPVRGNYTQAVGMTDLTPTILDAFSLLQDGDAPDGKSFWGDLHSGTLKSRAVLMENRTIHYQFGWSSLLGIRTQDWKWIDAPEAELYSIQNDFAEVHNVAPSNQEEMSRMKKLWSKLAPAEGTAAQSALSPEEQEKLESLGYLSGGKSESGDFTGGPDPKQYTSIIDSIEKLIRARQNNDFSGAQVLSDQILQVDPANLYAQRIRAEILCEQNRYAEALPLLEQLILKSENHPETIASLAKAYERTGKLEKALQRYQQATAPPWIYWPALEALARFSQRNPELVSRQDLLQTLKSLESNSYRETLSVARSAAILGEYSYALDRLDRCIQQNPNAIEALVEKAQMLSRLHRFSEAQAILQSISTPTGESTYVLGTVYRSLNQKELACDQFRKAVKFTSNNPNLLFGLGFSLQTCGETESAIDLYIRAIQIDPDYEEPTYNLAQLEEGRGNRKRAAELYSHFIDIAAPQFQAQKENAKKRIALLKHKP